MDRVAERVARPDWPEPCIKCRAEARIRKFCERCEEAVYEIAHTGTHYMGGGVLEVVPCRCSELNKWEAALRSKKKKIEAQGREYKPRPSPAYVTTPEMAKKAAENLARGMSYHGALKDAGFPDSTCKRSRKGINRMIRTELKTLGRKYIRMGYDLTPEEQEALVRGRLYENVVIGTDKGVISAKQLGADKRVSMWQPDSQVGMVVLAAPPVPKFDHEIPLIETRAMKERSAMLTAKSQEENGPQHEETPADPDEEVPDPEVWEEEEEKHAS